jgi:predicted  nucleic acid-binding Zn-ribbon protein
LLKSGEEKVEGLKLKLNAAASNREYQALKDQIAADQMAGSVLADEILEVMEKIDELAKQVAEQQQKIAVAKEELAKAQQAVRDQAGSLDADVKRLEAELRKAESALPDDFRQHYQRLVNSKHEDAMAEVQGEFCGGCFQQLTPNNMAELSMSLAIFCRNCGRLIYLAEDRTPGR